MKPFILLFLAVLIAATAGIVLSQPGVAKPPVQCCAQAVATADFYAYDQLDCDGDAENGQPCVDNMEQIAVAPRIVSVTRSGRTVKVNLTLTATNNVSYGFTVTTSLDGEFVSAVDN